MAGWASEVGPVGLPVVNPEELAALVTAALNDVASAHGASLSVTADEVPVERPKNPEHGDWASNAAMKFAKPLGTAPQELAAQLAAQLVDAHIFKTPPETEADQLKHRLPLYYIGGQLSS